MKRKPPKPKKPIYSTFNIVKMFNIKRATLQDWITRGFIVPDIKAGGVGTRARFSFWNLIQIRLFDRLIQSDFTRDDAASIVRGFSLDWIYDQYENRSDFPNDELYMAISHQDNGKYTIFLLIFKKDNKYSIKLYCAVKKREKIKIEFDRNIETITVVNYTEIEKSTREITKEFTYL